MNKTLSCFVKKNTYYTLKSQVKIQLQSKQVKNDWETKLVDSLISWKPSLTSETEQLSTTAP